MLRDPSRSEPVLPPENVVISTGAGGVPGDNGSSSPGLPLSNAAACDREASDAVLFELELTTLLLARCMVPFLLPPFLLILLSLLLRPQSAAAAAAAATELFEADWLASSRGLPLVSCCLTGELSPCVQSKPRSVARRVGERRRHPISQLEHLAGEASRQDPIDMNKDTACTASDSPGARHAGHQDEGRASRERLPCLQALGQETGLHFT